MHKRTSIALAGLAALVGAAAITPAFAQGPPRPGEDPGIDPRAQLMITDLRVVEDPVRTNPAEGDRAVWTFKYLMENMSGRRDPAAFTLSWLRLWERDRTINGRVAPGRPEIRRLVLDPWLEASGGQQLDLNIAPFKLLAVVNRMDLRQHEDSNVATAGEGRFIFGVLGPGGKPLPPIAGTQPGGFLVIFEYELIAKDMSELRDWAMRWRDLGRDPLGSPEYNRNLEGITRRFTDRGNAPEKANGNAINQVRSNELALAAPWELREFVINARTGWMRQNTVALTPDTVALDGTRTFRNLINNAEARIMNGTFDLSPRWFGASALAGPFQESDFPDFNRRSFTVTPLFENFFDIPWSAAGIRNNDVRHEFALNTCGGCHRTETGANFVMVGFPRDNTLPESLGRRATLARFLTGGEATDPVDPDTVHVFADLDRRKADLEALLDTFGPTGNGPGPRDTHRPRFVH